MKKSILYIALILFILGTALCAQPVNEQTIWSSGTAYTLPAKRAEIGVFQPLRYGLSDKVELSTHPVLFFVIPNAQVKWQHKQIGDITLTSQHGITIPSLLMNLIAKEGIGGMISPEFDIPFILSVQNELLASMPIAKEHLFTVIMGLNFAWHANDLDDRTTIDLPVIFPRTNLYYQGFGAKLGCQFQGKLYKRWHYLVDADFFYYPGADKTIDSAFEQKGKLLWNKSSGFQLSCGYLLSFAEYPFGTQWHLLPLLDLQWAWSKK